MPENSEFVGTDSAQPISVGSSPRKEESLNKSGSSTSSGHDSGFGSSSTRSLCDALKNLEIQLRRPEPEKHSRVLNEALKKVELDISETRHSEPKHMKTEPTGGSSRSDPGSASLDSSGISEPGNCGITTSTPMNNSNDQIQVVSFRDSSGSSGILEDPQNFPKCPESERMSDQPTTYDWYGLPAPMFGTMVPNRIFVGGISPQTTELELHEIFSAFGNVRATKIISDRAGVSKGYGFITYETEQEAKALCDGMASKMFEPIILRERRLNIAPAVKKQQTRSDISYSSAPPSPPPYLGSAYYLTPGNAHQYYYHPLPLNDQLYQREGNMYGQSAFPYYAAGSMPPNGSMFCVGPDQQYNHYQNYPPPAQPVHCFAPPPGAGFLTTFPPPPPHFTQPPTFFSFPPPTSVHHVQVDAPPTPNYSCYDTFEAPPPFYNPASAY